MEVIETRGVKYLSMGDGRTLIAWDVMEYRRHRWWRRAPKGLGWYREDKWWFKSPVIGVLYE